MFQKSLISHDNNSSSSLKINMTRNGCGCIKYRWYDDEYLSSNQFKTKTSHHQTKKVDTRTGQPNIQTIQYSQIDKATIFDSNIGCPKALRYYILP